MYQSSPLKPQVHKYIELDFPEIITRKVQAIRKHSALGNALGPDVKVEKGGSVLTSEVLNLISADLRGNPAENFLPVLSLLSPDKPTLVLTECVLPYLPPSASANILQWFSSNFNNLGAITYEMYGLDDSFGRVMRENLRVRRIELPGVTPSTAALEQRYLNTGFTTAKSRTLKEIRASHLSKPELDRIAKLELVDEVEELDLVLEHYVIGWAFKWPSEAVHSLGTWSLTPMEVSP